MQYMDFMSSEGLFSNNRFYELFRTKSHCIHMRFSTSFEVPQKVCVGAGGGVSSTHQIGL